MTLGPIISTPVAWLWKKNKVQLVSMGITTAEQGCSGCKTFAGPYVKDAVYSVCAVKLFTKTIALDIVRSYGLTPTPVLHYKHAKHNVTNQKT